MPLKMECSEAEFDLLLKIGDRAEALGLWPEGRLLINTGLLTLHANGHPLDFEKLASATDGELTEELNGVFDNVDVETAQFKKSHKSKFRKK